MPDLYVSHFARTHARLPRETFGIKQPDRFSHIYVIGKTGVGKTTLLETMLMTDIVGGRGCALIDPHGDFAQRIAESIPASRCADTIYFDVTDPDLTIGYNPLSRVSANKRSLVASGIMDVFKKMWADAWGVRMEHILRNALLALLDQPAATLADVLRLLDDREFRREVNRNIVNRQVRAFWTGEFEQYNIRYRADTIAPVQTRIGSLLSDPRLNRILTRPDNQLRMRAVMDQGKVLIVNLAKGKIGEDSAGILGGLLVTALGLAAFSRADIPEEKRRPFFIYIDEFQNFTTLSIANMLSELRKFGVGVILAHQYLHQLLPEIRSAVLGNAGTIISFRLGAEDAGFIAREFEPVFTHLDLLNLPNHHIYLKLMIDGTPSRPFSATTLSPHG